MRNFFLLAALVTSLPATAFASDCSNFVRSLGDTHTFQINDGTTSEIGQEVYFAARAVVRAMRPKCTASDLNFNLEDTTKNRCVYIIPENPFSLVCYLESEKVGYFFVTQGMVDDVTITWNRWD